MDIGIDEIEAKLRSLKYAKDGVYDVNYRKTIVFGDETFIFSIKEHEYSFGVRYTITITVGSDSGDDQLLQKRTLKLSLSWLESKCLHDGIEQMETKLVEAMHTAMKAVPKENL